ncbi:hypothetical protein QBC47DRAFT_118568 [Echria macrotheca]|uniref:Uncharacterized protein n=1 Tax=Echria macrotheca TaxID=438768 RepID=A0AAJ0F0V5_9PEZI|nr:hypothetical protein QBC47DRAFT_118568 [Echria macrotheca]
MLKYTNKLHSKRVLVLGGTSGVGYSVAEAALEYGAEVIISGSTDAKVERILARLRGTAGGQREGAQIAGKACDLADTASLETNLEALLKFATEDGKRKLDHVVFTAGDALKLKPLAEMTTDLVGAAMAVRFTGALMLAKLLNLSEDGEGKYLRRSFESSFTLTGGTNTAKPMPMFTLAAGVGGGIEGLARGLAVAMKPVRVNTVALGAVKTEIFGSLPQENLEATLEGFKKQTLTGTVGRPEDAAEIYLYIMRDYLVDGTVVSSDGGRLLV